MDYKILKKSEPIYIIGHSNTDADSIISSKLLSDILNYYSIKSYYVILNEKYDLDDYNRRMILECMDFNPLIISKEDINNHNYFLVDHNNPIQSVGEDANIIGCIDHHINSNKIKNCLLSNYCSTSLFIYSLFKDKYQFSDEQKYQIYMAFLNDSTFAKSSRYKKTDKKLVKTLGFNNNYNELFKKYFIPTNTNNGIKEVFKNGYKKHNINGIIFESSYIETFDNNLLNEYIKLIQEYNGNFLGIWINYDNNQTYAYFKYNNNIKIFNYNYIASRAATILMDAIDYINTKSLQKTL